MINFSSNMNEVLGDLITNLNKFQPGQPAFDNVLRGVTLDALANVKDRIHSEGKATDGNKIGDYSKKPIYISAKENPGKSFGKPTGKKTKAGNVFSKFQSGEKKGQNHASKYFEKGYDQFKTEIGRNLLGSVNLSLSGQLQKQLTMIATDKGYGIGWPNDEMFERAGHLEKKYKKKIWQLTEEEKKKAGELAETLTKKEL